ncbi:hypothetical protein ACVPOR_09840 [Staphylococcus aureus]
MPNTEVWALASMIMNLHLATSKALQVQAQVFFFMSKSIKIKANTKKDGLEVKTFESNKQEMWSYIKSSHKII